MPPIEARLCEPSDPLAIAGRQLGLWLPAWRREARRLVLGSIGPVAVAGTQFAASMLLWANVSAREFGLFAFLILLIQLSFGLSNAIVGTPLSVAPRGEAGHRARDACLAAHAVLLGAVSLAIPAVLLLGGARGSAIAYAALAVTANLRWAARSYAIAEERVGISARSDSIYAGSVALLLGVAAATHHVGVTGVAMVLAVANVVALAAFSRAFLVLQVAALRLATFRHYRDHVWPHQARWAVAGVISTEASSNAHAYIVTWLAGATSFAPLAFGALFCRPLTIFLTALNQIDRPVFARHLQSGALDRVRALLRINFGVVGLIWLGNFVAAIAILWWFSGSIAARGYDAAAIRTVVLLWFAIMALRAARNPVATFLQAGGEFRPLAYCSFASAVVSIVSVWGFVRWSPTYSLLGIVCGEVLLLGLVARAYRRFGR